MSSRTRFSENGLVLASGEEIAVLAGEVHYWRHERRHWQRIVQAARALELSCLSTYVPWSVHERPDGRCDFSGARDLGAFLDLAQAEGLHVLVRPGPHCNAELTHFGFPQRVLKKSEMQARTARGTPAWLPAPPHMFPVPSYASRVFQAEVRAWLQAVGEVVGPRRHPEGSVVAVQIDNEMAMFFRLGAFDLDYHPDALEWWHEHTGGLEAPRRFETGDEERCLRWIRFREEYAQRSLHWLREAVCDAGMDELARYHNAPSVDPLLLSLPALAEAVGGVCGMDLHARAGGHEEVRRRALYLASSTTLPFVPELGVGGAPWLLPASDLEHKHAALGALAGGVRALSFYMLARRERWAGGALDEEGQAQDTSEWLRAVVRAHRRTRLHTLRRRAPVTVVLSRVDHRFGMANSALDAVTPILGELVPLGPSGAAELSCDAGARRAPRLLRDLLAALEFAEIPYHLLDEDSLHLLAPETRLCILLTHQRAASATWAALHALAAAGVQILFGPGTPERDELGRRLGEDAEPPAGAGRLDGDLLAQREELAAALLDLVGDLGDSWIAPENPEVHVAMYEDAAGTPRVLFVGNRSAQATRAAINVPERCQLDDLLSGESVMGEAGVATLTLDGHAVRMLEIRVG